MEQNQAGDAGLIPEKDLQQMIQQAVASLDSASLVRTGAPGFPLVPAAPVQPEEAAQSAPPPASAAASARKADNSEEEQEEEEPEPDAGAEDDKDDEDYVPGSSSGGGRKTIRTRKSSARRGEGDAEGLSNEDDDDGDDEGGARRKRAPATSMASFDKAEYDLMLKLVREQGHAWRVIGDELSRPPGAVKVSYQA
jgi:hypothetical protein